MKLELTPALERAFTQARQFAARDRALAIEARHLLAALLAEEEGKAVALLLEAYVDWPRLQAHLGLPFEPGADVAELPLHNAFQSIMLHARELTAAHGDEGSISTDHMLLAILTVGASLREELAGFGLDFALLKRRIVGDVQPLVMTEELDLREPTEEVDTARILDASANRAREALRVLEDYARFALNDAFLSGQLKQLRHDLAKALYLLPASQLLEGRDTPHDVGTAISTAEEWDRPSIAAVVQANAKRLQEAMRSLEEFGKIANLEFAQQIEKLRYASYTLERALVRGGDVRERLADAQLCVLVTDALCKASLAGTVKEAILGGAQMIQLREKNVDDRTLLARARDVRKITQANGVLFIVNDRPDIARLVEADGVHLGQDDLPVQEARRILGPDALIGVSTHSLEQVRQAILDRASYIGVGPTFSSHTKDFDALAGLEFVRQAMAETSLPAFAIGGIAVNNIAQVRAAGARRVAVSHAVCAAEDPRAVVRDLQVALMKLRSDA
jgi:thiamine-phosphate pyrophosphorylase